MNHTPILRVYDVFKVEPYYVLNGKTHLAYIARWPEPYDTHMMKFIGTVKALTESEAISKALGSEVLP